MCLTVNSKKWVLGIIVCIQVNVVCDCGRNLGRVRGCNGILLSTIVVVFAIFLGSEVMYENGAHSRVEIPRVYLLTVYEMYCRYNNMSRVIFG